MPAGGGAGVLLPHLFLISWASPPRRGHQELAVERLEFLLHCPLQTAGRLSKGVLQELDLRRVQGSRALL